MLAWHRTGLAATGSCLLAGLTALRVGLPLLAVPAAMLAVVVLTVSASRPRRTALQAGMSSAWRPLVRMVTAVVTVALLGVVVAAAKLQLVAP